MFEPELRQAMQRLVAQATARHLWFATAESCTGGLLAGLFTEIPGSSAVFDRGFVTYSNQAKMEILGVDGAIIARDGAVSRATACAMVEGALAHSRADIALAITGIAGPGGGSPEKPEGLVWFACQRRGTQTLSLERRFGPLGRSQVRAAALATALMMLREALDS
ncbi:MAG: CinA family protein [Hyphomicrobiales bacterium]|nr:CinA family protein [Hyphomicrobiales bacterium]